jgi:hypothetical protein
VTGISADRELPVVWAVAKGSAINKLILVPVALAISALAPWAVLLLLMIGGAFLCFEGFEKVAHRLLHSRAEDETHHRELVEALADPQVDLVAFERDKIKGAIRTDFVLSAEIVVISLGTVSGEPFGVRLVVLAAIAALMTVCVYGLVAGIVRLDDIGRHLNERAGRGEMARPGDPRGRAGADEAPVDRRNGGDVPRRRWHPHARHPAAPPRRRERDGGGQRRCPRLAGRDGAERRDRPRRGRADRRGHHAREEASPVTRHVGMSSEVKVGRPRAAAAPACRLDLPGDDLRLRVASDGGTYERERPGEVARTRPIEALFAARNGRLHPTASPA